MIYYICHNYSDVTFALFFIIILHKNDDCVNFE